MSCSLRVLITIFVYYFKMTYRSMITIHSMNKWSQVITGVELNGLADKQGAQHVLLLISPTQSGEWKAEWTFVSVAESNPVSVLICSPWQGVTITQNHRPYMVNLHPIPEPSGIQPPVSVTSHETDIVVEAFTLLLHTCCITCSFSC